MWPKLAETHARMDWFAVAHDVEIRDLEVHDAIAARRRDVGLSNVPLVRHRPIEHLRSARHAVARDAPTDGIELGHESEHSIPRTGRHDSASKSGYERSRSLMTTTSVGH